MNVSTHIKTSIILSLIFYFWIGAVGALIVFFSGWIFDADHWLRYILWRKNISLKEAYLWHRNRKAHKGKELYLCHTIEFMAAIGLILGYAPQIGLGLVFGWGSHMIMDFWNEKVEHNINIKSPSTIYHIYKYRRIY
jgi:hypothetical protein